MLNMPKNREEALKMLEKYDQEKPELMPIEMILMSLHIAEQKGQAEVDLLLQVADQIKEHYKNILGLGEDGGVKAVEMLNDSPIAQLNGIFAAIIFLKLAPLPLFITGDAVEPITAFLGAAAVNASRARKQ